MTIARPSALLLAAALLAAPLAAQSAAPLRPGDHEVVLNGIRVWYRVAGNARSTLPPLVFLHGGPGYNSYSFAALAGPRLEKSLRVVYYDERGSGRSERPWTGHYQLDTLVADVEALRRHLGVPKLALMGHSFGGTLALEYAAAHPDRVAKLVLVSAAGDIPAACAARVEYIGRHYPDILARARADTSRRRSECELAFDILPDSLRGRVNDEVMFPDLAVGHMQDSVDRASGLRNTGELGGALFNGGLLTYRFAAPRRLSMPVLILAGADDYAIGLAQQRALAASLPDARLVEYEHAGHFLYLDQPERFTRDVVAFLGGRR